MYCAVLLAQWQWKRTVEIPNLSQLPIIPLYHDIITMSLPISYILRMILEDVSVRQIRFVTCQLWIFSSSQISSVNWSRSQRDVLYAVRRDLCWWQKLFVDLTCFCQLGQVEIGEQIFCDLLWHRKGGLFPSWVGGREGNLSLDLHRAFLPLGFLTGSCSSLSAKEFLSSSQPQIHLQIFSSFPNELELSTEL